MMEGIIQGVGGFVGGVQVQDDQFESGMQRITHILGWWGQLIIISPFIPLIPAGRCLLSQHLMVYHRHQPERHRCASQVK